MHYIARIALLVTLLALAACGGGNAPEGEAVGTAQPVPESPPQIGGLQLPAPQPGVQLPAADPVEIDFDSPDAKATSAVYRILFRDAVNEQSAGRWSVHNLGGYKSWELRNTCFSPPKAWVMGGNYWNNENDWLESNPFLIQPGTDGLAVTFKARWKVAQGDVGVMHYLNGTAAHQVTMFPAGTSNPSYPGWDKYYYKLPGNSGSEQHDARLVVGFSSNNSGTDWGLGVDDVAVYQTQLGPPLNVRAADGGQLNAVTVRWDHSKVGNLVPDGYDIYRASDIGGSPGSYALLISLLYPRQLYSDATGDGSTYWYKVVATKNGWADSPGSNEDSGYSDWPWKSIVVANIGHWDAGTSLARVNGNPAISYRDSANEDLKYAFSSTEDGSTGWTEVSVDTEGQFIGNSSLAVVDGRPAISYYRGWDLYYAFSSSSDGSSGWTTLAVDTAGVVGDFSSLAVVNNKPAISYYDQTNGNLKYAYSATADGSGSWTVITIQATNDVGLFSSLAVVNGKPAISYFDSTTDDLRYAYSSSLDGRNGSWSALTVDSQGIVGLRTSLAEVNGKPAISYMDTTKGELKYAFSSAQDGGSGWTAISVEPTGKFVIDSSLAIINGKPAISFISSGDLAYAHSSTIDGSSGWTVIDVDPSSSYCSLTEINGKPAISYCDTNAYPFAKLKYAWPR